MRSLKAGLLVLVRWLQFPGVGDCTFRLQSRCIGRCRPAYADVVNDPNAHWSWDLIEHYLQDGQQFSDVLSQHADSRSDSSRISRVG